MFNVIITIGPQGPSIFTNSPACSYISKYNVVSTPPPPAPAACHVFPPFAHTTYEFVCLLKSTYGYLWVLRGYFVFILVLFWCNFGVILV